MSTLSNIELLWMIVTLAGLIVSSANLMDAADDYRFAERSRYNATIKRIVASEHLRYEGIFVLIHSLFYAIGFLAAITPASPSYDDIVSTRVFLVIAVLLPGIFFTVQIAMIFNSLFARRTRKRLILQRLDPEPPQSSLPVRLPFHLEQEGEADHPTDIDRDHNL